MVVERDGPAKKAGERFESWAVDRTGASRQVIGESLRFRRAPKPVERDGRVELAERSRREQRVTGTLTRHISVPKGTRRLPEQQIDARRQEVQLAVERRAPRASGLRRGLEHSNSFRTPP